MIPRRRVVGSHGEVGRQVGAGRVAWSNPAHRRAVAWQGRD
jgi:hypothetical protein